MIQNFFKFIQENPDKIAALIAAIYEVIVRVKPTKSNWSIIDFIFKLLSMLVPNNSKDFTTVKNTQGLAKISDKHVTVIKMIGILMLFSISSFGQLNGTFKSIRSYHADSLTVKTEVQGLQLFYDSLVGGLYYNSQHVPGKWRIFYDSQWHDLIGSSGSGGGDFWKLTGTSNISSPIINGNPFFKGIPTITGSTPYIQYDTCITTFNRLKFNTKQGTTFGNFYTTLNGGFINTDGQRDEVLETGYNMNGAGGRVNPAEGEFHTAIESHYIGGGTSSTGDFEYHIEGTTRDAITNRYMSMNCNKDGQGLSTMFFQMQAISLRDNFSTEYANFNKNGSLNLVGSAPFLKLTSGSNITNIIQNGSELDILNPDGRSTFKTSDIDFYFNNGTDHSYLTLNYGQGHTIRTGTSNVPSITYINDGDNYNYHRHSLGSSTKSNGIQLLDEVGASSGILSLFKSGTIGDGATYGSQSLAGSSGLFSGGTATTKFIVGTQNNNSLYIGTNNAIRMKIDSVGSFTVPSFSGSGTRMVTASSTGVLSTQTIPSGGTPASPVNSIQYNNAGAFGGSANYIYNGTSQVTLTGTGAGNPDFRLVNTGASVQTDLTAGGLTTNFAGAFVLQNSSGAGTVAMNNSSTGTQISLGAASGNAIVSSEFDIQTLGAVGTEIRLFPTSQQVVFDPGGAAAAHAVTQIFPTSVSGTTVGHNVQILSGATSGSGRTGNIVLTPGAPTGGGTTGWIVLQNLPTTTPCGTAPSGTLWSNAGILTVCP